MVNMVQLGLRVAELIFTVIIMGLTGNMIATAFAGNPSAVNFTIFVTVFAMITLFYLIAINFKEEFTFHKFVPATVDILNVLFFFCSAVALSAQLGAHSCSNGEYTARNRITNGSHDREARCREAQASTFFLWITWACFCASLFFTLRSSGGVNMRSTRRTPNMSQV